MNTAGNMPQQPTVFFGPIHAYTQYNSLPRRGVNSTFHRNTPIRRSAGIPEHHIEYFAPRSMSEFNLAGVGDLALPPPPKRLSPTLPIASMNVAHGMTLRPPPTIYCGPTMAGPTQLQIMLKPREKMVTFEDESKPSAIPTVSTAANSNSVCLHNTPSSMVGISPPANIFM